MTEQKGCIFRFGEFEVREREFYLLRDGQTIPVEPKAFRVLLFLLHNPHRLITKEELLDAVWPETAVSENSLTRAVALLRRLLGDDTHEPRFIATVPTVGYRLVADVTVIGDEAASSAALARDNAAAPNESSGVDRGGSSQAPPHSSHRRRVAWIVGGIAVVIVGLSGAGVLAKWQTWKRSQTAPIRSLAVLPLEDLSGDPSQEYFADGMTDELITELARIPGLRVVSRTSVMRDKGTRKPLDQIARELNVDAVVEGSVVRVADKVRITAQLTDARSDKELWAQSFEGRAGDILSLQDDVAREIAAQAKVALTPAARAGKRIDAAAHDDYLRGRYFLDRREGKKSAYYFQQAIAIDPTYAAAFAGLADALHSEITLGEVPLAEGFPKALAAAKHTIELDPMNGEAYSVLGTVEGEGDWNWEAAGRDLRRGVALSPSDSLAVVRYAIYLGAMGHPDEAVAQLRRALETDPLSFYLNRHLGVMLYFARHYDEALYHLRRAGEMDPSMPDAVEGWASAIYEKKGMQDEAVRSDLKALSQDLSQANLNSLHSAYQRGGWKAYQKARIELMTLHADTYCTPYGLALAHLRIGEVDRAFSFLNQAIDQHCWAVMNVKVNPLLDDIRTDPRYDALVQRMKLPQ